MISEATAGGRDGEGFASIAWNNGMVGEDDIYEARPFWFTNRVRKTEPSAANRRKTMGLFERSQFADPDDDAGVMMDGLGRALVTWAAMRDKHPVTVADAALAFNTTPEVIREAVDNASWILIVNEDDPDPTRQLLELDGE